MKLILLRHGESQWNLENRFTGWTDVSLTKIGVQEAQFAANQILSNEIKVQSVYSSILKRAEQTAHIVAEKINFQFDKIEYDWRLNERHYGALQGLNKSETAIKYGEDQVKIWRRSFDIAPPKLSANDERHPKFNPKFKNLDIDLPVGESLKDVIERIKPFIENFLKKLIKENENHMIVAHSNSLRAIVKVLENLNDKQIIDVNIPTGVPLVYETNKDLNILDKKYLIDENSLKEKENLILQQGKIQ
tara:strand:+ start:634 stop:1374 length:741 start_codon:yes stop_codon:yes gene_type:complete